MKQNIFSTDGTKSEPPKGMAKYAVTIVIILFAVILLFNCFTIVNEGFMGVRYRFGAITGGSLSAGLNFHLPFVEEIQQVDIRNQVYETVADAYTSDTQTVDQLILKLNYYYDQSKITQIIREIGVNNVQARLLVPNVAKIAKNEIGKVKAEDLVQTRSEVQQKIQDELTEVLAKDGIIVSAFAIENLKFDAAFEASIQAKVIAAQAALTMENKTKERQEEAKQVIIAAEAEAESIEIAAAAEAQAIELIQKQLGSTGYIDYLKITRWDGILPQIISDGINPFVSLDSSKPATTGNAGAPAATQTPAPTPTE